MAETKPAATPWAIKKCNTWTMELGALLLERELWSQRQDCDRVNRLDAKITYTRRIIDALNEQYDFEVSHA